MSKLPLPRLVSGLAAIGSLRPSLAFGCTSVVLTVGSLRPSLAFGCTSAVLTVALAAFLGAAPASAAAQAPVGTALAIVGQAEIASLAARAAEAPYSADAQFELAIAYARTPFPERAWEALERVTALDADYANRLIERYGATIERDPADQEARFRLAIGLYFRGRREAARRQLEVMNARAPHDPWVLTYLGWLQADANRWDQAIATWQRAVRLDPANATAHWLIGQGHYRKGRSQPAATALKTAQALRIASPLAPK